MAFAPLVKKFPILSCSELLLSLKWDLMMMMAWNCWNQDAILTISLLNRNLSIGG